MSDEVADLRAQVASMIEYLEAQDAVTLSPAPPATSLPVDLASTADATPQVAAEPIPMRPAPPRSGHSPLERYMRDKGIRGGR